MLHLFCPLIEKNKKEPSQKIKKTTIGSEDTPLKSITSLLSVNIISMDIILSTFLFFFFFLQNRTVGCSLNSIKNNIGNRMNIFNTS